MSRFTKHLAFAGLLALLALPLMSATGLAQGLDTNSADLPPDGVYLTAEDVHAKYSGAALEIVLEDIMHKPIADRAQREAVGNNELETFPSELEGVATVDQDGPGPLEPIPGIPVFLTGPVQTVVTNRNLSTAGLFDAEIVSMSLSGNVGGMPVIIRESPTQASAGETDILDLGGGLYHIDSFFDVFTELSVDGGNSWIASDAPVRMTLTPEPGTGLVKKPENEKFERNRY